MTPRLSRRELLQAAAALSAGAGAAGPLVRALDAMAATPVCGGSLNDVEHVVILMQENRSFDHYFGRFPGARGFDDRSVTQADGTSIFSQRTDLADPSKRLLPFHIDTTAAETAVPPRPGMCTNDVEHQWTLQHQSWNGGALDRWVTSHIAFNGEAYGPLTMGYYDRGDLGFYYELADTFTLCDRYHCSVIGGTDINRIVSMTGTMDPDGFDGGVTFLDTQVNRTGFTFGRNGRWITYPEQLQAKGIDWRIYGALDGQQLDNVLLYFNAYADKTTDLYMRAFRDEEAPLTPLMEFTADCISGSLPQVSWVLSSAALDAEHPPSPLAWGEAFTASVIQALSLNPALWAKTALFITYDENGGFFDHVPPPVSPPKTPGEHIPGVDPTSAAYTDSDKGTILDPVGLGFRVPTIIVSPWTRGGLICSDLFDHTSILKFVERRFGAEIPGHDPAKHFAGLSPWRRQEVGDLTSAFNFAAAPDTSVPALVNAITVATLRADPRVYTECIVTGTPLTVAPAPFSNAVTAYPIPSTQVMPVQEAARGAVKRPSGLCAQSITPSAVPPSSVASGAGRQGTGLVNTAAGGPFGLAAQVLAGAGLLLAGWWARRRRRGGTAAED